MTNARRGERVAIVVDALLRTPQFYLTGSCIDQAPAASYRAMSQL